MKKNSRRFECEECSKEFWKPESRTKGKRVRFCSTACRWKYQRAHPQEFHRGRVKLKCPVCGKDFERLAKRNQAGFCSKKCYWDFKGKARKAADPNCRRCKKPLFEPHKCKSGLCLDCWRKHATEEGLCFKPKLDGWSAKHEVCVRCGKTDSEHKSRGICGRCYSKEQARRKRGTWKKKCVICGEDRTVNRAHIIPRRLGGPFEGWNLLCLCALHHGCFDEDELTNAEWCKIEKKVRVAFGRVDLSKVKRYGRQGLPWAMRRLKT